MTESALAELDLDLLRTLAALLEERRVSSAAAKLGRTQPTMSRRLKRLREIFRDPILVPGRGGMQLTPWAESMRQTVQDILGTLDGMLDPAGRGRGIENE
jgi:DNA-binding transcriptional LysR family regulator